MQIIKQSAELVWVTPGPEKIIERIGRVCYKSEDKITDDSYKKFIEMLKSRKHYAMLEHASASIHFITERGVTHEIVRHRLAAYAQESTRYCNYAKDKFGSEIKIHMPDDLNEMQRQRRIELYKLIESLYMQEIKEGITPQIARDSLPTCLKTEIVVTANLREWLHILSLRTAPAAQPKMRELMNMAWVILKQEAPTVFETIPEGV